MLCYTSQMLFIERKTAIKYFQRTRLFIDTVSPFRLLREKQLRDEEFIEICKLRQGAALHTIDSLLDLPVSPERSSSFFFWWWAKNYFFFFWLVFRSPEKFESESRQIGDWTDLYTCDESSIRESRNLHCRDFEISLLDASKWDTCHKAVPTWNPSSIIFFSLFVSRAL